jgi:hypothetical protein
MGGYIMAPLAVYNAVKNWQSGNTGADALQGAEAGAAIGSVVPGIGTLIGGLAGGAIGALSSAFGGGKPDPETGTWNQYLSQVNQLPAAQQQQVANMLTPQQAMTNLAGVMDAKNAAAGHSQPIEQVFGRMGENNLMTQMANEINQAYQAGQITPGESIGQQWNQTINPWLQSKGVTWDPTQKSATGQLETPALQQNLQSLMGSFERGTLGQGTMTGGMGVSGQGIPNMPEFMGLGTPGFAPVPTTPAIADPGLASSPSAMLPGTSKAEGGRMSALDHIYRGRFADRQHFQDGGSAYFDYTAGAPAVSPAVQASFDPTSPSFGTDPGTTGPAVDTSSFTPTSPYFGTSGQTPIDPGISQGSYQPGDVSGGFDPNATITMADGTTFDPKTGIQTDPSGKMTYIGTGGSSSLMQSLQSGLGKLIGQQGLGKALTSWGQLAPLLQLAGIGRSTTNLKPPTAAPGMTQGAGTPPVPMFNRQQIMNPSNLPGGAPMTTQDWYTYGSRPGAQFFTNNQLPMTQMTGVGPSYQPSAPTTQTPIRPTTMPNLAGRPVGARGGRSSALDTVGYGMPEFDSSVQHFAQGPGTGTSDNIPAQLSDGEYVMDANTVSLLGDGSNKAGAAKLDQLRENLRRQAARPMSQGKQFMHAKPPMAYMGRRR